MRNFGLQPQLPSDHSNSRSITRTRFLNLRNLPLIDSIPEAEEHSIKFGGQIEQDVERIESNGYSIKLPFVKSIL